MEFSRLTVVFVPWAGPPLLFSSLFLGIDLKRLGRERCNAAGGLPTHGNPIKLYIGRTFALDILFAR